MKGIQIILVLCLFAALYCDGRTILKCAFNRLDDNIINTFINKLRQNQNSALLYLGGQATKLKKAMDSCL